MIAITLKTLLMGWVFSIWENPFARVLSSLLCLWNILKVVALRSSVLQIFGVSMFFDEAKQQSKTGKLRLKLWLEEHKVQDTTK